MDSQRDGCRRARRARAGFEIDHSEPQARVWRSRGRTGPKAPDTQAPHHNLEPRPTSARPPGANTTCSQRGGCRRARRARAGFEIDHSEPQARVWRSCGRPGPKAPDTQAPHHNLEPRPTSARPPGANTTCSQRGGCRRARRARAGFEIDHSEPQARVWRSCGRPGPKASDTQAVLTDTSVSREKRGPVRTGNRVPSGGPRPGWRPPRLCPGRPGVPQPARSRGGRR